MMGCVKSLRIHGISVLESIPCLKFGAARKGANKSDNSGLDNDNDNQKQDSIRMNGITGLCPELNDISLLKIAERVGQSIVTQPITNRYDIKEEIGRGKYAVVKRVVDKDSEKSYAAKYIKKRRRGKCSRSEIMNEVAILDLCLANPWIVHMKEVYETSHDVIVVMEYAAGGELYHHCAVEESLSEQDSRDVIRQTLQALKFLHERNIVHLDIKPSNILLMNDISKHIMDVKLCDFSFARLIDTSADIREILGTPDYVAPEILSYEPIHTSADIWSVGVLTYVMLTGHSPFLGDTKQETFLNISQLNYDFPEDLWENLSKEAQDFIRAVIVETPEDRPTADQLLSHPWFSAPAPALTRPPQPLADVILTPITEEDDVTDNRDVSSSHGNVNNSNSVCEVITSTSFLDCVGGSVVPVQDGSRSPAGSRRSYSQLNGGLLDGSPGSKKQKLIVH